MKNILFGLLAVAVISLTFQSCKEDIELSGDFTETAVVYGLLDQADSIHMLKITRAFIGPGDAFEIAQIPDSSYFASVEGTVTEYVNGVVARVFTLSDTIVDNKDPNGVFYAPEQKLYYFETPSGQPLVGTAEYKLDLVINGGEFEVHGSTTLVNGMTNNNITVQNQPYRFVGNTGEYISTSVTVNSGTAEQINVTLNVEFTEWVGATGTTKTFDWLLGEAAVEGSSTKNFVANGETFYNLMADNCTNNAAIDKRTFNSITATITGGSEDFVNYMQVNEPSSTLAQSKPTFTNLTATNGHPVVGLFSSRNTITIYKPFIDPGGNSNVRCINKQTTERLCVGSITAPYFFCSDHPADIASGEPWVCN
jgi:hypothetical protein